MKKIIIGFVGLALLSSCNSKKSKIDPFESVTGMVDSAMIQNREDLLAENEGGEPVAIKADEIFDDFVYSFASDNDVQRHRVLFPLPYYDMRSTTKIDKKAWKHDSLFVSQEYYTLLFDKEEDMDMVQDTSLNSVQFEWIDMKRRTIKKYYFERKKGAWVLEAINLHEIEAKENEDFVDFFCKFVNDSVFQSERICQPLVFVTNDPDDEFSILETTIEQYQWLAFMPVLPKVKLTNINYGQRNRSNSRTKILTIRGINNSFDNSLYFRRDNNGEWQFYKFEDLTS